MVIPARSSARQSRRSATVATRRLANSVTLCDGHRVFFVAASGQIRMAADKFIADELIAAATASRDTRPR
jgi:hypothetical protein